MRNVIDLFSQTPVGIIVAPLLMSVIGALLYDATKKLIVVIATKFKKRAVKAEMQKATQLFKDSFKAGYSANHSSFHQVLFVSEYVIRLIRCLIVILVVGLCSVALIVIFVGNTFLQVAILSIASLAITIISKNAKETLKVYKTISSFVFGDDFYESRRYYIHSFWKLKQEGLSDSEIFAHLEAGMNKTEQPCDSLDSNVDNTETKE